MSRFFSEKYKKLVPYTPGEQPKILNLTKLNTNECPFPPSEKALQYAREHTRPMNLYSDIEGVGVREALAALYGLRPENLLLGNGSDEILNFAFMAFCDDDHPAAFPDISYGFYPVFANLNRVPYTEIPLREDFRAAPEDYYGLGKTIFLANPNAPTGIALSRREVEEIVKRNPDSVVVIDEAYVDFGGESCIPLIEKYENLLVVQTFSKSRSMAGARLGFAAGSAELIRDLGTIKFSTNPYNVNSMTQALGLGVLLDEETTRANCRTVMENRAYTAQARLPRQTSSLSAPTGSAGENSIKSSGRGRCSCATLTKRESKTITASPSAPESRWTFCSKTFGRFWRRRHEKR